MAKFFKYTRRKNVTKKDEKGQAIPETVTITLEDGSTKEENVPGKFKTEEKSFTDYLNLTKVIRTHALENGNVIVLLDDGHEETQKVPQLKNPNKKGPVTKNDVVEVKERQWVQSEILIEGDEVFALYEALEKV